MSVVTAPPAYSLLDLEAHDPKARGNGRERIFKCPVCGGSERSLHLNTQSGLWNCKRASCGAKGKLTDFWEQTKAQPARVRARAALQKAFALPTNQPLTKEITDCSTTLNDSTHWSWQWDKAVAVGTSEVAQEALEARGLDLEFATAAGVRFCANWAPSTEGKRYFAGNALLYPFHDAQGELLAVAGRYLHIQNNGHKARVGGTLRQAAFFAPCNGISPLDRSNLFIFLVEGPACALSLSMCGVPAIAVGGCNLSEFLPAHCGLRDVMIGSDCDAAGEKAAGDWTEQLERLGAKCQRLRADEVAPEAKDWNDALQIVGVEVLREFLIAKCTLITPTIPTTKSSVSTPKTPETLSPEEAAQNLSKPYISEENNGQNLTKPNILTKWHSRGAHLWLGTTTHDGQEYRTLEYEFDCAISPKWLKELERDKGFIQTALVAQEVRELSRRYWAERRAEAQAKAEQIGNEPEADSPTESLSNSPEAHQAPLTPQTAPPIDWEYINSQRAMQDSLSKKLGASKATYAIYLATNEILDKWKGAGREETPEAIHQAALELLCLRHKIPFDDCFDTEMSAIELDDENTDEEAIENEINSKAAVAANTAETPPHPQSEANNLTLGF